MRGVIMQGIRVLGCLLKQINGRRMSSDNAGEQWRPVVGYDGIYQGLYEVSDHFRVKSVERIVPRGRGGSYHVVERILKLATKPDGLKHVGLCVKAKRRRHYVHKLVREAFGDSVAYPT
jgi:NUMOD4 motif